jgi:broad specificity phosphatase PhoE
VSAADPLPVSPARRLLLVRHGLPDYRDKRSGDLWPGPPLAAFGHQQAAQAAAIVARQAPTSVRTSPMTRCFETACIVGRACGLKPRVDPDLCEWHRSESLYEVSVRLTRWLVRWLRGGERCAVAVSHASPLLAVIRSALYLPHLRWHKPGRPDTLEVSSAERLEVSMASVFELVFERDAVTARLLLHPTPRTLHAPNGRLLDRLPRPIVGCGENHTVSRRNAVAIIGGSIAGEIQLT